MKTKFKSDYPDEFQKFGIYYTSVNDVSNQYLIELCDGISEGNALVKIYSIDIPENHFDTKGLVNGSLIGMNEIYVEWIAEVDLWGKYFFPKFKNDLQLYYDQEKFYKGNLKSNSITSLMEAINYAIEYGINKSGIEPY